MCDNIGREFLSLPYAGFLVCAYKCQDLAQSQKFFAERAVLSQEMASINLTFQSLNCQHKFVRLMCPVSPIETKMINRFISNTFHKQNFLDENIVG